MARRYTRDGKGRFASTGGKAGRRKLSPSGDPSGKAYGRKLMEWNKATPWGQKHSRYKHIAKRGTLPRSVSGKRPRRT